MRKLLLVSFDFWRLGEAKESYAVASLLASIKNHPHYGERFEALSISLSMEGLNKNHSEFSVFQYLQKIIPNLLTYDYIAVSAYVWSDYLLKPFLRIVKKNGFRGKIILGGYQITYTSEEENAKNYPEADYFLSGYSEVSLVKILESEQPPVQRFWKEAVDFEQIPGIYQNKIISLNSEIRSVRLETKRGCPYRCSFCAHRDLVGNKIISHSTEKIFRELDTLSENSIKRINILDPVFNTGSSYISITEYIIESKIKSHFTFQTRLELLSSPSGKKFLENLTQFSSTLEFGIQSVQEDELFTINRKNNLREIENNLKKILDFGIDFEISLIYGLPGQTLSSFQKNIAYFQNLGVEKIVAYPLMLLPGTDLYYKKEVLGIQEAITGDYSIPHVIKCHTFTEKEYSKMAELANQISSWNEKRRIA
jgi:radical SAM superfamily enzyme YgiQ (UPF0313 family)